MIKELLITFLAMTKTTEYAANWLGVKPFLPALSGHRFALLSLREVKDLLPEMEACTSFKDDKWTSYWTTISLKYLRRIEERVGENLGGLLEGEKASSKLNALLAGGISLIRDTPPGTPVDVERFIKGNPGKAEEIRTLDDAIKVSCCVGLDSSYATNTLSSPFLTRFLLPHSSFRPSVIFSLPRGLERLQSEMPVIANLPLSSTSCSMRSLSLLVSI